jgi:glycosyltransferase involved in cell wall biosynthesis
MTELRFGALVLAYKQEDYLAYCLRALAPHVECVVALFTEHPWVAYNSHARTIFTTPDGSREILDGLQAELPNLRVTRGIWSSEESMRNDGLRALGAAGMDVCVIIDADEVYPDGGLDALKSEIVRHNMPGAAYYARYQACFRRFDHVVETCYQRSNGDGVSVHRAPAAVHLATDTTFYRHRNPSGAVVELPESLFFWHFGYVLSNERMWEKIHTFGHAHEILPWWFEEKWLRWTPDTRDLFFKDPPSRWPRTIKIDTAALPRILGKHPYFPANSECGGRGVSAPSEQ